MFSTNRTFLFVGIVISLHSLQAANSRDGIGLARKGYEEAGHAFRLVSAEESGLAATNDYAHPERWGRLWHQYFLGTIGSGIAIGDVDGDQLADVFLVGKDSQNHLYLNRGGMRFSDESSERGILAKTGFGAGATFVDIDNDGDLDLYVTYTGSRNELYINDGSGRFREDAASWGLALLAGSNAPSFADYDRDGDLDLYLQCNFWEGSGQSDGLADYLFENKGTVFEDVTEAAGVTGFGQGHAAVWWDYNEDGWPDLYVANDFAAEDRLYRNNRDGTFSDVLGEVLVTSPYSAMGADVGDLNNDGLSELLVGEMLARTHSKYQRTVATIETKSMYSPRNAVSQYMQTMLSVKIGDNQFTEISRMTGMDATDWTWAVRIADFDNDGLQDVFFANGMVRAFHDGDIGVKSDKARTGWQRLAYYKASPQLDEQNLVFRNKGDFEFEEIGEEWGLGKMGVSFAAALADFDLDGDLDLLVGNMDELPSLYENRIGTGNSLSVRLKGVNSNAYGVGAKVYLYSEDAVFARELTLTRGYLSNDEPVLHFGMGERETIDRLEIHWPSGAKQTVRGLEPNMRYEIQEENTGVELKESQRKVFVKSAMALPADIDSREDSYRLYPKQMLLPEDESRLGPRLLVADLDRDGFEDVVVAGPGGDETKVLWNVDGVRLELGRGGDWVDDFDSEDSDLLWSDFDSDGISELLVSSGGVELAAGDAFYKDRFYSFEQGRSITRKEVDGLDFASKATGRSVLIDYDGDGDLDLLQAGGSKLKSYPNWDENIVWRFEGGVFRRDRESEFSKAFAVSGNTSDLVVVDWDGDGLSDLLQSVRWGSPVVWRFDAGQLRRQVTALDSEGLSGSWSAIATGDFDGDGRMDFVAGNRGANLRHVPSAAEPLVLFAPKDVETENLYIDCFTEKGRVLPIESRILNAAQFPGLLERTTTSIADYADKDVFEIFTPEVLARFNRFEMKETRTMVFYQKEAGRFTPSLLPFWAQSGVVMDALVADVDGDSWEDIVLTLEPRAPKLWVDRPLKGHVVLLKNKAGRGFETLLPRESGLEVDGHPRHMAWADLNNDGNPELILTMSDGPLLVFSLNSVAK